MALKTASKQDAEQRTNSRRGAKNSQEIEKEAMKALTVSTHNIYLFYCLFTHSFASLGVVEERNKSCSDWIRNRIVTMENKSI